jgi:hypothetical protein
MHAKQCRSSAYPEIPKSSWQIFQMKGSDAVSAPDLVACCHETEKVRRAILTDPSDMMGAPEHSRRRPIPRVPHE